LNSFIQDYQVECFSDWCELKKLIKAKAIGVSEDSRNPVLSQKWLNRIKPLRVSMKSTLSIREKVLRVVAHLKKEKSAEEDGLPAELYQRCLALVDKLIEVWIKDRDNWESGGEVISLRHKKGDKRHQQQPITLLNVDHKILASAVLWNLKFIAAKVIGKFQH